MKRLEEQLSTVSKPSVDLPLHRARLRRTLFRQSPSSLRAFTRFPMSLFKLLPAGLALAVVFGLAFSFRSENPDYVRYVLPTASAEELVNGSIERLQAMTPEEIEALASDLGSTVDGLFQDLEEASVASDLSFAEMNTVACDSIPEEMQSMGFVGSDVRFLQNEDGTQSPLADTPCLAYTMVGYDWVFTFQGAQEFAEAQSLTGVQYTNSTGDRVILLLSENLNPYMGLRFSQDEVTMTFGG